MIKTNFEKTASLLKLIGLLLLASPLVSAAFLMILLSENLSSFVKLSILSLFTIALATVVFNYHDKSIKYEYDDSLENPSAYI